MTGYEDACAPHDLASAINRLVSIAHDHALSFSLIYSEIEGCWYAEARGQGAGEFWEVKRASTAILALQRLAERLVVPFSIPVAT